MDKGCVKTGADTENMSDVAVKYEINGRWEICYLVHPCDEHLIDMWHKTCSTDPNERELEMLRAQRVVLPGGKVREAQTLRERMTWL